MDNIIRPWNSHEFVPQQTVPCQSLGPMYHPMNYSFPPTNQSYHNYPNQYSVPPPAPPNFTHLPSLKPQCQADEPIEIRASRFEAEDKEWVANWLAQQNIHPVSKTTSSSSSTKIMDVRDLLLSCLAGIKELQKQHSKLSAEVDSDDVNWNAHLAGVQKKQREVAALVARLQTLDLISVKQKLKKRTKKRKRLRQQRIKLEEIKQSEEARRKMLHQRADAWMAEKSLAVEREHREEELRKEADAVLGEVTRKQTEAKRQVALLDALIKLRAARAERAAAHSSNQDVEAGHYSSKKFVTVIDRLRKMWDTQLKEYASEERGLRVMLQELAEQKSDARCQSVRSIIALWEKAIFGESGLHFRSNQSIDELIAIRRNWDKFVVPSSAVAPMASSIPVGWVLPQEPSSASWRSYCVAYTKND